MALDKINYLAEATYTGAQTTTADLGPLGDYLVSCRVILDLVSAAADGTDTLNVYVQSSWNKDDYRPVWDDFISFTQLTGVSTAGQEIMSWNSGPTPEDEQKSPADAGLAAGSVLQGPTGRDWRLKIVVVSGTAAVFRFRVVGDGMFYK